MEIQKILFILFGSFVFVRCTIRYTFTDVIDVDSVGQNEGNSDSDLRIVGGTNAQKNIAPWVVSIQYAMRNRYHHMCGGTVLSPEWIITAGHCITSDNGNYEIAAGRHDLKGNENSTEQRRTILKTFVHPEYKGGIGGNDIALIQLKYPLVITTSVSRVKLPNSNTDDAHGAATLYGWGSTSRSRYPLMPNVLQTTIAPIISTDSCRQILRAGTLITDNNICTGPINGRVSACSGDSGSALTKNDIIIGIVSWGLDPCGSPNSASVYTRVSKYTNWILSTIAKEERFFIRM